MRWAALEVDYEMSGKDLIDSVRFGSQICRVLGAVPPENLTYELFLDEQGEKISKSARQRAHHRGVAALRHAREPGALPLRSRARPSACSSTSSRATSTTTWRWSRPPAARHPPSSSPTRSGTSTTAGRPNDRLPQGLSFGMLLNLASVVNAEDAGRALGLHRPLRAGHHARHLAAARRPGRARRRLLPRLRPPHPPVPPAHRPGAGALAELALYLRGIEEGTNGEAIQNELYEIGKRHGFTQLRDWFRALYEILLGQSEGPRFGSFVAIYGVLNTRTLIEHALTRTEAAA